MIGALSAQPIRTRKAQSRNKIPHTFAHLVNSLEQMSRPCLIISKSCYFEYRINKPFHVFSLLYLRFVFCSRDLDVLRAQRIMGFFILITHKSMRSEVRITRYACYKEIYSHHRSRWSNSLTNLKGCVSWCWSTHLNCFQHFLSMRSFHFENDDMTS